MSAVEEGPEGPQPFTGGCLCGGVRYAARALAQPVACHCSQCARTSGHFTAMAACDPDALVLLASQTLVWFASSPGVERGFCGRCGGNLFWREADPGQIYVTAGTLDRPTGLALARHIFVGSKSDYYELSDGLEKHAAWPLAPESGAPPDGG